jgi:hypothetical protein
LANIPFVCLDGHAKDEQAPAPEVKRGDDPRALCRRWQADCIEGRQPKHLPPGRGQQSAS